MGCGRSAGAKQRFAHSASFTQARHIKSLLSAHFSPLRVICALLLRLILGQFPGKFQKTHFRSYFYWHNNCSIAEVAVRIDDRA